VFKEKRSLFCLNKYFQKSELVEKKVSNFQRSQAPYEVMLQRQLPSEEGSAVGRSVLHFVPPQAVCCKRFLFFHSQ